MSARRKPTKNTAATQQSGSTGVAHDGKPTGAPKTLRLTTAQFFEEYSNRPDVAELMRRLAK
jgi:hypothetical protein